MGIITSIDITDTTRRIMKYFAVLAFVVLLGVVAAEETQQPEESEADMLKLDYHVRTKHHLLRIIHRLKILRNRCHHRTAHHGRRCKVRIHWYIRQIKKFRHILRVTTRKIHIYKKRFHLCRRN